MCQLQVNIYSYTLNNLKLLISGGKDWSLVGVSVGNIEGLAINEAATILVASPNGGGVYISTDYYSTGSPTSTPTQPTPYPTQKSPTLFPTFLNQSSAVMLQTQNIYICQQSSKSSTSKWIVMIVCIVFAFVGVLTYYVRRQSQSVIKFQLLSIIFHLTIYGFDMISDLLYVIILLKGGLISNPITAAVLGFIIIFFRIIHPFQTYYLLTNIVKENGRYKNLIDSDNMSQYAKEYALIITIGIVESPVMKFLPFHLTDFSARSGGWADIHLFRIIAYGKLLQTAISSVMQITVLFIRSADFRNGYCDFIVYVSITTSILLFLMAVFEIIFQGKNTSTTSKNKQSAMEQDVELHNKIGVRIDDEQVTSISSDRSTHPCTVSVNPIHSI